MKIELKNDHETSEREAFCGAVEDVKLASKMWKENKKANGIVARMHFVKRVNALHCTAGAE